MTANITHASYTLNAPTKDEELIIQLNGISYRLIIDCEKLNPAQRKEIVNSYSIIDKNAFQRFLQKQIQNPCGTIGIEISPTACRIQGSEGTTKKIPGFNAFQSIKFFQTLLNKINEIRDKNLNPKDYLKISLKEIIKKRKFVEQPTISKDVKSSQKAYLENIKKFIPCDRERIIGLERLENNCCVNATLQIILNNPELREIWEEFFPETKDLYYKALKEGKSSAPNAVGNE